MTVKYQTGDIEINVAENGTGIGTRSRILRIRKHREKDADLQDIAINTPFNDNYPDARTCYEARCNAHIWERNEICLLHPDERSPRRVGLIMEEGAH